MKNIMVSACMLGVCCRYDGKEKAREQVLELLKRDDITLIPICPEQWGGLPTPRPASERQGSRVVNELGVDVTAEYERGAQQALKIARLYECDIAILKERSPSCGKGMVYDGTFTGTLTEGDGVTAELLTRHGIRVIGESQLGKLDDIIVC